MTPTWNGDPGTPRLMTLTLRILTKTNLTVLVIVLVAEVEDAVVVVVNFSASRDVGVGDSEARVQVRGFFTGGHTQTFTKLCLLAIETNEVCPFRAVQKAFSLTIKKPAINDFFFIF